jgi:hypothetical protein
VSTAGAIDLPLDIWGGLVTDMPTANLSEGVSGDCADVKFTLTGVATRPGLQSLYAPLAGNPTVNYVKSYIDPSDAQHTLFLDSLGNMWHEFPQGTVALLNPAPDLAVTLLPGLFGRSATAFGREYIALSDGNFGKDVPRQFDGTYFDRVSQDGPGGGPSAVDFLPATAALAAQIGSLLTATIAASPTGAVRSGSQAGFIKIYLGNGRWETVTYTFSTLVTITTTAAHGFSTGDSVTIAGVADSSFDGTFTITVTSSTTFTYAQDGTLNATSGGGTATDNSRTSGGASAPGLQRAGNIVTATTTDAHGFQAGWTVKIAGVANVAIGGTITAISRSNSVVTVATSSAHGLVPNSVVNITGVTSDATFNGVATVATVPSATTFTFAQALSNSSGTVGASSFVQDVFAGVFTIASVPSTTTFTYANVGPDNIANGGTAAIQGNVTPGQHQVAISFVTRQGYVTRPSPPVTFSAGGGKMVSLSGIPTGPANVAGRIVMFTAAIAPPAATSAFYYVPATMVINDNTTTSLIVDFSDVALIAAQAADTLFGKVTLGQCLGAIDYAGRLFWWGEKQAQSNWVNLRFDGGWSGNTPLGWTIDPTYGTGGGRESNAAVWGDAFKITGDGTTAIRGKITQPAYVDYNNVPLIQANTSYSVRAKVFAANWPVNPQGTLRINLASASGGFTTPGLAVAMSHIATASSVTAITFQEVSAELIPASQITGQVPSDLTLQLYMDGTASANGYVIIDEIEIYPTSAPTNPSVLRVSNAFDPESFDGVTGLVEVSPTDGQQIRACFKLREFLYVVKDRSLYVIQDDPSSEPSGWSVKEVSNRVGTCSVNGAVTGADSAIIINRDGAFLFWGSAPGKISQEISPPATNPAPVFSWESINWSAGQTIWALLDMREKRALIGVPYGAATSPDKVLYFDFRTNDRVEDLVTAPPIHVSSFSGKLFAIAKGRKWAPWNITANCGALIERSDGTAHAFLGNGAGNGKVYDLLDSQLSDDGAAINSYYLTYFVPSVMLEQQMQLGSHMKLFTYLTLYVEGSGTLTMTAYGPGQARSYALPSITLSGPSGIDQGYPVDIGEERVAFKFGTNAAGSWFRMNRLIMSVKAHPTMPIRGI